MAPEQSKIYTILSNFTDDLKQHLDAIDIYKKGVGVEETIESIKKFTEISNLIKDKKLNIEEFEIRKKTKKAVSDMSKLRSIKLIYEALYIAIVSKFEKLINNIVFETIPSNKEFKKNLFSLNSKQLTTDFLNNSPSKQVNIILTEESKKFFSGKPKQNLFEWFGKVFEIDIDFFKVFSEDYTFLREHRNIIVHNGSKISDKFLAYTNDFRYGFLKKVKVNDELDITEHFRFHLSTLLCLALHICSAIEIKMKKYKDHNEMLKDYGSIMHDFIHKDMIITMRLIEYSNYIFKRLKMSDLSDRDDEFFSYEKNLGFAIYFVNKSILIKDTLNFLKNDKRLKFLINDQSYNLLILSKFSKHPIMNLMYIIIKDKFSRKELENVVNNKIFEKEFEYENFFVWKIFNLLDKNKIFLEVFKKKYNKDYNQEKLTFKSGN